jgi:menaquinone-9 beta-reductase
VKESDLPRLHNEALTKDPFIAKAIGKNAKIERMRAAPLRLGGQGIKTCYDNHLIIVGDAAGHIDPLTGEGIHTAIQGGKAAAMTLLEMREGGDYSSASTKVRWQLPQFFLHL